MNKVAIVGLPNVGKTTLIRKLVNKAKTNIPTRDWQEYVFTKNDKSIIIIDTPGITYDKTNKFLAKAMSNLSEVLATCSAVYLLYDGKNGLTYEELEFKKSIYKLGVPLKLVSAGEESTDEYHIKIDKGLKASALVADFEHLLVENYESAPIKLAILGRPNVGKSTLLNKLTKQDRAIVTNIPGTTLNSTSSVLNINGNLVELWDTAGIRKINKAFEAEKIAIKESLYQASKADVVLLLIDIGVGLVAYDKKIIQDTLSKGKPVIIVLNKIDLIPVASRDVAVKAIKQQLPAFKYLPMFSISAVTGFNLKKIVTESFKLRKKLEENLSTSKLTKILADATLNLPPPLYNKRPIKLRMAHLGGKDPLVIIIHGTRSTSVPTSYKRYLFNYFQQRLNLNIIFKLVFKDKDA